jgi:very-short-patch-repair endonuclease
MILVDKIKIKINSTTLKYYREKGYNVNILDEIDVNVSDLTKSSNYKIKVACDICNTEKEIPYNVYKKNINKYNLYACSNKCAIFKNKKTKLELYGDENYVNVEKIKKTNINKYGVENVFQNDVIKETIKKNNIIKYGVESANSDESVKNNKKISLLKKYGVECLLNTEEQKIKTKKIKIEKYGNLNNHDKLVKTFLEKYEVSHPSMVSEFIQKRIQNYKKTMIKNKLLKYKKLGIISVNIDLDILTFECEEKHIYEISNSLILNRLKYNTKLCTVCNPIGHHSSGQEILLTEFIKNNYNKEVIINSKKIISPLELDIYLPDLKLAFEFNGLYYHDETSKASNYHYNKTQMCEAQGIQLIHIYEDDWKFKQEIVKSRILNLLGKNDIKLYARKCIVKEISDNKEIKRFLENNHLQGFVGSQIKLGLYYNNELVSLMTFGKQRKAMGIKSEDNVYEMLRFCNKLNTTVIGSANKLFNYFIKNYKPKEVISYADRSWSQGNLYKVLGFEYMGKTIPNYYYVVDGIREYRFNYRKDILVKQGFDKNKSEHEIMLERKIYRIYDSGSLKYVYKKLIYN